MDLDELTALQIVQLMNREDARVALRRERSIQDQRQLSDEERDHEEPLRRAGVDDTRAVDS